MSIRVYCHHCRQTFGIVGGVHFSRCLRCHARLDEIEPHHVLRGRVCPGGCGTPLAVIFEPATGAVSDPICPICLARWSEHPIERDGVIWTPALCIDVDW